GDVVHGLPVAIGRSGKAGLDDVDAEPLELTRDAHFLFLGHRCARTLLAVAQRRVENDQMVSHVVFLARVKTLNPPELVWQARCYEGRGMSYLRAGRSSSTPPRMSAVADAGAVRRLGAVRGA